MITIECCTKCAYAIMGTSVPVSDAVSSFLDVNRGCRYSVPSVPPGGDTCDVCGCSGETIEVEVVRSIEYWLRGLPNTIVAAKALSYARRSNVEGVDCDNLAYALISIHNWNDTDEGFGLWANLYNALCRNSDDIGTCYRDLVLKMRLLFEDKVRGKKIYWSYGDMEKGEWETLGREKGIKFVEWLDDGNDDDGNTFLADDGWPASAYGHGLPEYDDRLEEYNGKGLGYRWVIESVDEDEDEDAGSGDVEVGL